METISQLSGIQTKTGSAPRNTVPDMQSPIDGTQLELPLNDEEFGGPSSEVASLKGCTFGIVVSNGSSRLAVEHAQKRMAHQGGRSTLLAPASELAKQSPLRYDDESVIEGVHSLGEDRFHEFGFVLLGPGLAPEAQQEIRSWLNADGDWPRLVALGPASAELLEIAIDHVRTRDASAVEEFMAACHGSISAAS